MEKIAERALDVAHGLGASYADVRVIDQSTQSIETKNDHVAAVDMSSSLGAGVRILSDGGWGFASTQDLSDDGIAKAVKEAMLVAKASAKCIEKPIELAKESPTIADWISPCQKDPFGIDIDTKVAVLLDSAKAILAVPGVTLAHGRMHFIRDKKYFASTEGSKIFQIFCRTGCGIQANATADGDQQRRSYPDSDGQWELAGWEMVEKWNLPAHAQRIGEESVALLRAPSCPQETKDIILGGSQVAIQLHESCGHPCELDRALGQEINYAGASFLTPDKLNKLQYGSPIVNIVADATAAGALGSFGFDDEGVPAQRNFLIKDGVFRGYLSSRDTAALIGLSRSGGNMRAASWKVVPIIRMTNVSLLPGSNGGKLEDLIADTKDGILLDTNKSWSIDQLRYNFQFSTECAWEIKNGKRGKMLKNASYGGITTEFWNSCDAICGADEYVNWGTPNCGKGQPSQSMWTGHGASPARFRNIKVGIAHSV